MGTLREQETDRLIEPDDNGMGGRVDTHGYDLLIEAETGLGAPRGVVIPSSR